MVPPRATMSLALPLVLAAGLLFAAASDSPAAATPRNPSPHFSHYTAAEFTSEAADAPSGLNAALMGQLGITTAQFYADGAAAAQAAQVVTALKAEGVSVGGSQMEGTTLVVYVSSQADAVLVNASGATASLASPPQTPAAPAASAMSDPSLSYGLADGSGWWRQESATVDSACSVGFNGYDTVTGASEFLTAGHCDASNAAANVFSFGTLLRDPASGPTAASSLVGSTIPGSFFFGNGWDSGLVAVNFTTQGLTEPWVTTWGDSNPWNGELPPNSEMTNIGVRVVGKAAIGTAGAPVCRSGYRTGWQCGYITGTDTLATIGGSTVNAIQTSACADHGDSGGPLVMGAYAIGILSGSNFTDDGLDPTETCDGGGEEGRTTFFFPLISSFSAGDVAHSEPDWQLQVYIPTPTVTSATSTEIHGTVAVNFGGSADPAGSRVAEADVVSVRLNGGAWQTATFDSCNWAAASQCTWHLPVGGLPASYTYAVMARSSNPAYSLSASTTATGRFDSYFASTSPAQITGALNVGSTVHASISGWSPTPTVLSYQWYDGGTNTATCASNVIEGATGASFTLPANMLNHYVWATVTGSAPGHEPQTVPSSHCYPIGPGAIGHKGSVTVTGTMQVGHTISAHTGSWEPSGVTTSYQWFADGVAIKGATRPSYALPARLGGEALQVAVTVRAAGYSTMTMYSATYKIAKGVIGHKGAVTITGAHQVGHTLTAHAGTWTIGGIKTIYHWYAGGKPIKGASSSKFKLTLAQQGRTVTVRVTGSKAGYVTRTIQSARTALIR